MRALFVDARVAALYPYGRSKESKTPSLSSFVLFFISKISSTCRIRGIRVGTLEKNWYGGNNDRTWQMG